MKKALLFLLVIFCSNSSFASHGMGGEIIWTCDGTGNYIFNTKFYRDCNGIPGPGSMTLSTTVPGVPNILCNLVSQTDISPDGSNGTGNANCPTCVSGGNGAVEEFVFQSAPTILPGVPPSGGWAFWWGDCCRSAALTNIANGGSVGFGLRAMMYPFPGQAPGMCSDNSPYFAERPSVIICTGYPFTYNHLAIDPEMDSINYSWASPIDNVAYPWTPYIPFQAPYSITNQVPGNPTLDQHSGQIAFNAPTGGYFATEIEVDAYKCGTKVAEVYREINVVLISGCTIPTVGNPPNNPPIVPAPFADTLGNPMASYDTIVHAGDTVNFVFAAADFDFCPVFPNGQIVNINASGQQFGAGFTNTTTGCLIPPCATLTPPPPTTALALIQTAFHWTTTTAHLGLNYNCVYLGNKYYFVIRANDNYCPANGITNQTISVTILPNSPAPLVTFGGGQLTCLTTGNYSYQWFLNRFAIGGATSQTYTPVTGGYYQVLAVNNATGDGNYSAGISVSILGIEDIQNISDLNIYPNPSRNRIFQLSFAVSGEENLMISIKDVMGKSLTEKALSNFTGKYSEEINLSSFSKGIYTVELKTENGKINKKLILL